MLGALLCQDNGSLQVFVVQAAHGAIIERALFWESPDLCLLTQLPIAKDHGLVFPDFGDTLFIGEVLDAPLEGGHPVFVEDASRC